MRPLEIILSLSNLLTLSVWAIPRLRATRWLGNSAWITLLLGGAQVLIEGSRWQMVPAYALAVVFFLMWLVSRNMRGSIRIHRLVAGGVVGLGVLTLAVSTALPIALPVFHFPAPGGPYRIGTVTYHWTESRHEIFSADPNAKRQLMVQVWYPAQRSPGRASYVQDAAALSRVLGPILHLPGFAFDYLNYVTTYAAPAAPMETGKPTFPVLIYVTGMDGFAQASTFQVQALVSRGYIVVGIDQPYAAAMVVFPNGQQIAGWTRDEMQPLINQSLSQAREAPVVNGRSLQAGIIPYLAQDVGFTLDQLTALDKQDPDGILTGRLDLQHIGIFGVSLGAMVAGEAAHRDPRIKAALMMDAAMPADVVQAGLRQPAMWITRNAATMRLERERSGGWSNAEIAQTLSTMRAVFYESHRGDGYYVEIPGMFHINFTDAPYWSPLLRPLGVVGPINAQRGFDIVNAYSLAFFNKYLKGIPSPLLNGQTKQFPEVHFARSGRGSS